MFPPDPDGTPVRASPRTTQEITAFPATFVNCASVYCEGTGSAGQLTYRHTPADTTHTLTLTDNQDKPLVLLNGTIVSFTGTNLKVYDW